MASGLPDFGLGVRPQFGAAESASGTTTVTASDWTTLATILGKGMLYGGFLGFNYTSTQRASLVRLVIDGNLLLNKSFQVMNALSLTEPRTHPLSLLKFDDTEFIYCVGFSYGLTFEQSLVLQYFEEYGTTPAVTFNIVHGIF